MAHRMRWLWLQISATWWHISTTVSYLCWFWNNFMYIFYIGCNLTLGRNDMAIQWRKNDNFISHL
jgi:hypothetical protein